MKTSQGAFAETYHHIDAPTYTDGERTKELGRRVLVNPKRGAKQAKIWREPELEYLAQNQWAYKRKLNGENLRVKWDGERAVWNGKSDDFDCKPDTVEYMNATFPEEIFEENFGREKTVLLFGERMGEKCQGNELGISGQEFVLYDIKIDAFWLEPKNIVAIARYFNLHTCYDFMPHGANDVEEYSDTLENLIDRVAQSEFTGWEGIVAAPATGVFSRKGERIIVKIKNKEYGAKD